MWDIICYSIIGIALIFLWLTAVAGTKYYEMSMQLRDIKSLKFIIHLASLSSLVALAYIVYIGYYNV